MAHTSCDCKPFTLKGAVLFCPLHAAALDLLEALKEEVPSPARCETSGECAEDAWWQDWKSGNSWWFCNAHKPPGAVEQYAEARAAITKAEGKSVEV